MNHAWRIGLWAGAGSSPPGTPLDGLWEDAKLEKDWMWSGAKDSMKSQRLVLSRLRDFSMVIDWKNFRFNQRIHYDTDRFGCTIKKDLQRSVTPSVGNIQKQKGVKERIWWRLPLQVTFKIHVDAAFNPLSGDAAVGVVTRDCEEILKLTAWRTISHCRDAEEAEARACLEGANMALRRPDIRWSLSQIAKRWLPSSMLRAFHPVASYRWDACCGWPVM
jgi:hypothetical protein